MLTIGKLIMIGLVLALIGLVIGAIWRVRKERRQHELYAEPDLGNMHDLLVDTEQDVAMVVRKTTEQYSRAVDAGAASWSADSESTSVAAGESSANQTGSFIALNVFAQNQQTFSGYELLQALLAAGLRFGEMNIFHRYQQDNGQGPILFSLASATEPGTFDIQQMGTFSCQGLSMFMELSGHPQIDEERFDLLLTTARQLAEDLAAVVLNDRREPLVDNQVVQYQTRIRLQEAVA
jgi:cell division protein ZipA